jgi:VWFA-related protein
MTVLSAALLLCGMAATLPAWDPSEAQSIYSTSGNDPGRSEFQVSTGLVLVPMTVTDYRGATVNGLSRESFTVLDNRRPQPIAAFYSEDAPCSVGIVFDISGSVRNKLDRQKEAVHAFLELANPEDDFFLATVSSSPTLTAPPGSDASEIETRVRGESAGGWTALYDTIETALKQSRLTRHRCRALLVISDGIDNHSRETQTGLMHSLVEGDVQVYGIAIEDSRPGMKAIALSAYVRGLVFLDDVAAWTGGLSLRVSPSKDPAASGAEDLDGFTESIRDRVPDAGYRRTAKMAHDSSQGPPAQGKRLCPQRVPRAITESQGAHSPFPVAASVPGCRATIKLKLKP